jgi:hypothetical protein
MWVWREETVRGGWRLDDTGSWTYDEPARLERVAPPRGPRDPEPDRIARERFVRAQRARSEGRRTVRSAVPPRSEFEPTPIFRSVAHEVRERHDDRYDEPRYRGPREVGSRHDARYAEPRYAEPRYAEPRYDVARREERAPRAYPDIPAPHPGSGPFPAQERTHRGEPTGSAGAPAASTEDELRRRAERRRRPRVEPESGRHALRH